MLSDVRLPKGDGISLLEWMRKERMDIPFIIMTGEHLVNTVAPFDISVLILGPNGAGKESVARRIHYIANHRDMPFVAVNCGVIPKDLAPSLFFGHI